MTSREPDRLEQAIARYEKYCAGKDLPEAEQAELQDMEAGG